MKVLLFAPSQSIHTHKWAQYFQQKNIDVLVVTFPNHYDRRHAQEVNTIRLPKRAPGKLSYLPAALDLKKVIRSFKPDVVHAHYLSSYGFIAAFSGFHPLVVSVWGSDIYQFPKANRINKRIVECALRKADVITSTSQAMREEIGKYTDKPVEIVPFGVDTNRFAPKKKKEDKKELRIGIAKGLKDIYGFPELFQAMLKVVQSYPQAKLWVMGDGPERSRYEQMVQQLNLTDSVIFKGHVDNREMPEYLNQLDLFVLPSHQESFGVAALEAEACGIPVVVNGVGGLPEVVIHGETGLVMPNNQPETIAEHLLRLLSDSALRKDMGDKGRQFVLEHFAWEQVAMKMLTLYEKTLHI